MTDRIAFIGVGNMGNPMADQLVKAGKKVKAYDVSQEMIKKANIALRYLSLMRGKSDISQKSIETLKEHLDDKEFKFGII